MKCLVPKAISLLLLTSTLLMSGFSERVKKYQCPPLENSELTNLAQSTGPSDSVRLVFFSTWCLECAKHLRQLAEHPDPKALAIAVFDERKRVEAALEKMDLTIPCRMDNGLAERLGVKAVPAERRLARDQ